MKYRFREIRFANKFYSALVKEQRFARKKFSKNNQRSSDFTLSKSIISSTSPPCVERTFFHKVPPRQFLAHFQSEKCLYSRPHNFFLLPCKRSFLIVKLPFLVGSPPSPPSKFHNLFEKRLTATIFKQGPSSPSGQRGGF